MVHLFVAFHDGSVIYVFCGADEGDELASGDLDEVTCDDCHTLLTLDEQVSA